MRCPCCGVMHPLPPNRVMVVLRMVAFIAAVTLLVNLTALALVYLGVDLALRAAVIIPMVILLAWTVGMRVIWWTPPRDP